MSDPARAIRPWWRGYDHAVYDALPEFDPDPQGVAALGSTVARAGAIIRHCACEERLGICLLHRHFGLSPDERLVRHVGAPKCGYARPQPSAAECMPWVFALAEGSDGAGWYPVEWMNAAHCPPGAREVLVQLGPVADAIAEVLLEMGVHKALGLASLYAFCGFALGADQEICETTDKALRKLTLTIVPIGARGEGATQTLWRFHSVPPQPS